MPSQKILFRPPGIGHRLRMGQVQTEALEREVKFGAPLGVGLPDLRDLVSRTERLPRQQLQTAYFDTPDGHLWDQGITLRHRTTPDDGAGKWTLKLPAAAEGSTLNRTEVSWTGPRTEIPGGARTIVQGLVRRQALHQLVELGSSRQRLLLHDKAGHTLAEIDDDTVTVKGGPRDGLCFRQVELELHDAHAKVVRKVTARLKGVGLSPETTTKLGRAMGFPVSPVTGRGPGPTSSLGDVVRTVLTDGLTRLLGHDWRLRAAVDDTAAEDIHQARVATRRLRSDLRTFDVILDPVWVRHVRSDLEWLGSALGDARDTDVLAGLLEGAPDELGSQLAGQRAQAARRVSAVLADDRYLLLLDHLHAAASSPPFVLGEGDIHPEDRASKLLPVLVGARWRALRRQVRKSGHDPSDERLHRIRIKSKQLRYAAEAATAVMGEAARRTAEDAEDLQTLLGQHHDAVTAESWLRARAEDGMSPAGAFEAGRMAAEQERIQRKLRHRWRRTWAPLAQPKRRRWMS
jgi:CHAD domain-containing protein